METYIVIAVLIILSITIAVMYGSAKEKKNIAEKQLKLGDKIDKIINSNNNINKRDWVNWLQDKRNK